MTQSTAQHKAGNAALLETIDKKIRQFALELSNVARAAFGLDTIDPVDRALGVWDIYDYLWETKVFGGKMDSVLDIYMEEGKQPFAVFAGDGKLYSADLNVSGSDVIVGELREVIQQFVDAPQQSRTIIRREANGDVRFVVLASTATLNRDGQIDGVALFDSMVEHADSTGEYPYMTFWHEKLAVNLGQADLTWRDGYCYMITGLFNKDCPGIDNIIRSLETDGEYWGISIGFKPTSDPVLHNIGGISIPVYQSGVNVEFSILPERAAASHLTNISIARGNHRMNEQKRDQLSKLVNGDVDALNKLVGAADDIARAANATIAEKGMITRNADAQTDPEKDKKVDNPTAQTNIELSEELVAHIATTVLQSAALKAVNERLDKIEERAAAAPAPAADMSAVVNKLDEVLRTLDGRLSKLETPVEQQIRQAVVDVPAVGKMTVGLRPSQNRAAAGAPAKPAVDHTKV